MGWCMGGWGWEAKHMYIPVEWAIAKRWVESGKRWVESGSHNYCQN